MIIKRKNLSNIENDSEKVSFMKYMYEQMIHVSIFFFYYYIFFYYYFFFIYLFFFSSILRDCLMSQSTKKGFRKISFVKCPRNFQNLTFQSLKRHLLQSKISFYCI